MVDEAEVDRAVVRRPGAVVGLVEADRFAGQRLVDVDGAAPPLDLAVVAHPTHRAILGIVGLAQHTVPGPRRGAVVVGRRRVAEGLVRPLFLVDLLEVVESGRAFVPP